MEKVESNSRSSPEEPELPHAHGLTRYLHVIIVLLLFCAIVAGAIVVFRRQHGDLFEWIHRGGYPILFLLLFCCGLGLPLPEDIPLITSGILVEMGEFKLGIAAVVAWCGIIGGDCMLYMLGKRFGRDIVDVPIIGSHITLKRLDTAERWFARWGVWVVAVGRMFAGVRGAMVVVAGTSRFTFWKFLIADGLAAVVSGGVFVFLGYKFAEHRERLHHLVRQIKSGMLIGAVVLLVLIAGLVWWRKRQQRAKEASRGFDPIVPTISPSNAAPSPGDSK